MSGPLYSYTPEECASMPMVLSLACAEGRHGECRESFRCDCAEHRAPLKQHLEALQALRTSPAPTSSSLPDSPYRSEAVQDEPTRCWSGP